MKYCSITLIALLLFGGAFAQKSKMLVRLAELEIDAKHLTQYQSILKEEARASVLLEAGVISIYPMFQKEQPTLVRILEIYASREAYEAHLKTPHFQKYKSTTGKMVKSLRLVDMQALDPETMSLIFKKSIPE